MFKESQTSPLRMALEEGIDAAYEYYRLRKAMDRTNPNKQSQPIEERQQPIEGKQRSLSPSPEEFVRIITGRI